MDVELQEIRDFIAQQPPFDWLSEETLDVLVRKITIRYLRKQSTFPPAGAKKDSVYLIRQGALKITDSQQQLIDILSEGDICYSNCASHKDDDDVNVIVAEDTLLYLLSCATIKQLASAYPQINHFINKSQGDRLRLALKAVNETQSGNSSQNDALFLTTTEQLLNAAFEPISASLSIQEVAQLMTERQQSAAIILESDHSIGIITDQDLRSRCIAKGIAPSESITQIMTRNPKTTTHNQSAFRALLMMSTNNIHHLPVLKAGQVIGIISGNDIIDWQSNHSLSIARSIEQCDSREALINVSLKLPQLQANLMNSGYTAYHFGQAFTSISDAITRKLIELAQLELGKAPVDFVWLAVGSQGRQEQSVISDQDNALLIANQYQAQHQEYFSQLANYVNTGIDLCGQEYCPGKVMANNPQWRKTLTEWQKTFRQWIEQPEKKAIMLACNFFDLRPVYTEQEGSMLVAGLQDRLFSITANNSLFIAALTAQAIRNEPPLGFFRQFVLQGEGSHANSIDLKINALILISDIARVFALKHKIKSTNTIDRLKQAANTSSLSSEGSENLIDSWEMINSIRLNNQARQITNHESVDNYLAPDELSALERNHLKDCFSVIRTIQKALEQRSQSGRFT